MAYLAIIGVPPFSGFYSKDKIIEAAFTNGWAVGITVVVGAGITAFYMTRMVVMTFFGPPRWTDDPHPHDPKGSMAIPMILLAFGSVFAGYIGYNNERFINWLSPVTGFTESDPVVSASVVQWMTLAVVGIGVLVAVSMYGRKEVPVTPPVGSALTRAAREELYGNAFNEAVFMRPGQWLTRFLVFFDNRVIDGIVNGVAALFGGMSSRGRRIQTGYARSYALSMFVGAAIVVGALLLVRL